MSYADRFNLIANNIETNVDNVVRNVIETVGTSVITNTPILTGQARRNWQAAVNTISSSVLEEPESPEEGQQESIAVVKQVARQYKSGDVVHITNNVPYIQELNNGSSKQAPSNFVEIAVLNAIRFIKNVKVSS